MTQQERCLRLIQLLAAERGETFEVPDDEDGRRALLRALMNVRMPEPAAPELLELQDAYLKERLLERGVHAPGEATPAPGEPGLSLWQGDITTLAADAVVNAANSQMLGCFVPGHHCIDNAIHSFAGIQLRLECYRRMRERAASGLGEEFPTGEALVTPAFNLPSKHVIHTVGPIVGWRPGPRDELALTRCYESCLAAADAAGCTNVAFCCISTGVFHYPNEDAARVALSAVRAYKRRTDSPIEVIFNVFLPVDYQIYARLLGIDR